MITDLHVRNVALIDEADITFTPGLNVLTGETGAGKSILIEALGLALGDRADTGLIRQGSDSANVELTLRPEDRSVYELLHDSGIDTDEDDIIIRRKLTPGSSDCYINGQKVALRELSRLTSRMIDICGQRESLTLLRESSLKNMLDSHATDELREILSRIGEKYTDYSDVLCKLNDTDEDESLRKRKADLAEYEVNEIDNAALTPGEDEELEIDYRRMNNASRINESLSAVSSLIDGTDGASDLISRALKALYSVTEYDESLQDMASSLSDIDALTADLSREIGSYMSSSEYDAASFNEITARLDLINHLKDKYGRSIEAILAYRDERCEELDRLRDHEAYRTKLENRKAALEEELLSLCARAHDLRASAAASLESNLMNALTDMNFLNCDLKIEVKADKTHITASGYDDIDFLISLNPGEPLKSLKDVASGGELSRIMLAIKCVSGDRETTGTLIFDEIDTGISGVTAWKVGEKLHSLGASHQVICITHQAQVAAQADTHFVISKSVHQDRTLTAVDVLDEDGMIDELMRMSGSGDSSEAARNAAVELKAKARLS
ncbi:MAG: DNA repair protein RecN [Lachnospiraceae bacterium]|nr:DNA repair protein RecN [Lachnospiraceae bacterium]